MAKQLLLQITIKKTSEIYLWLDLGKLFQLAQELKSILLPIIIATLKDYPDTVAQLL